nr:hypothetical protein Iba_chr13fCG10500 [Ipomoea batatas]
MSYGEAEDGGELWRPMAGPRSAMAVEGKMSSCDEEEDAVVEIGIVVVAVELLMTAREEKGGGGALCVVTVRKEEESRDGGSGVTEEEEEESSGEEDGSISIRFIPVSQTNDLENSRHSLLLFRTMSVSGQGLEDQCYVASILELRMDVKGLACGECGSFPEECAEPEALLNLPTSWVATSEMHLTCQIIAFK